jgi:hypothetical protein
MKLASRVIIVAVAISVFCLTAFSQATTDPNRKTEKDPRNEAPTVGTGGPTGGPTGLFTVYDGKTLRKGEHTLSIAYSNYDRDPGNMDFTEVPVSFQIALSNNFEVFYQTDVYRGVKVNSLRNISGPYLPNSGFNFPAIVLAPQGGTSTPLSGLAVFRPAGTFGSVAFPFFGGNAGTFGLQSPNLPGQFFGFCAIGQNCVALIGSPIAGASNGSFFPGVGSAIGGILPGLVLTTTTLGGGIAPAVFSVAPSYNPDAPPINKQYGESWFNTHTGGFKWRWTNNDNPVGVGIVAAYRWFHDRAPNRIEELFDGASPGGNRGDILGTFFVDARVGEHVNISANVGYHLNSDIKANVDGFSATLLNRPDELLLSAGIDFPINQWFQPIVEVRHIRYVRSRTENAFENHPWELLGGFRIFPKRWFGFSFAYRRHMNQQDSSRMEDFTFDGSATVLCRDGSVPDGNGGCIPVSISSTVNGVPPGFILSENPHGWIAQFFIGRRNPRLAEVTNQFANVTALSVSDTMITLPCPAGFVPAAGATCNDATTVTVTTTAVDPENDVLTYNYTVSGGRIVGTGASVSWDLSGLQPGTYTITAGVDDGCGLCGQTQTQTVTIAECQCVRACTCPTGSISGPAGVTRPGETMTFTANISGGPDVTYNWTVSRGTIESGQGTPSIVVRTSIADAGQTITATLNLGGTDPTCNCVTTYTESGPVDTRPEAILVDEFGRLANDDIRGRLDNFFQELSNNPNNQGYIINYGTDREITARERLITNHITFRNFDRSRITLVRGGDRGNGPETRLYRIPPGAENPNP